MAVTVAYNGSSNGNWSNALNWIPTVVPNNSNGVYYNAAISGGSLTQDIAPSVTIQQLQMSGGTLTLANPLNLNAGLMFTGGNIYNGILNIARNSTQSATMGVNNTSINNSGTYDVSFENGAVFNGGANFQNTGTLTKSSGTGTTNFNAPLYNNGTVSAQSGTLELSSAGTNVGGTMSASSSAVLEVASNFNFNTGTVFSGAGTILFTNGTATNFNANITNSGNLDFNSTGSYTDLFIVGSVSISGGGTITLRNADRVRAGTNGALTNVDNTIEGETSNSGTLGNNDLPITNQSGGTINANVNALPLIVDPANSGGLTNQGLMEASNGGILVLTGNGGGGFDNTNGTIEALNGSQVQLTDTASVSGGILTTAGSGQIVDVSSAYLTTLTNAGQFVVTNGSNVTLTGTITNTGTINLNSTGAYTDLFVNGGVTLTGGGTLILSNADRIRATGNNPTLTNVNNLIEGETSNSGTLGNNDTAIINQSAGVINANTSGLALVVDPGSSGGLTNAGLMEATNGGILNLTGNGGGGFSNSGTIEAFAGSEVQLSAAASIVGGTLSTSGTGIIRVLDSAYLDNLTNTGSFIINNGANLTISDTITNKGTITQNSTGSYTDLFINGNVTLNGGGTLILSQADRIRAANSGAMLTNVDNTIEGETSNSGTFGNNDTAIINQANGVINANVTNSSGAGLPLVVDPGSSGGLTNAGLMEATNGGILYLTGNGGGGFSNSGTIEAFAGSEVQLANTASVVGGTLSTSGTGIIRVLDSAYLDNLTIDGSFIINNGANLTISDTITNKGTITQNSTGNYTDLFINGNVTLNGGGTLILSQADRIRAANSGATLTNVDNTIEGETSNSGTFGNNDTAIINESLINANVNGLALVIDPVSATTAFVNATGGILRASNGGILVLTGNGGGGFDNTNGTIEALNGSQVQLTDTASVSGGILTTAGSGQIVDVSSAYLTTLTNAGQFVVTNGSNVTLTGTITNTGTINLNSTGSYTDLFVNGGVTLTGGGTLILSNADRIRATGNNPTLTNVNNLIEGETSNSGTLGNNDTAIINQSAGVINANTSGLPLVVDPGSSGGLTNAGLMEATNGGILYLTGNGGGGFSNSGTIEAFAGSEVQLSAAASIVGGTLSTSGTGIIRVLDSAYLDNLTNTGSFIINNGANLTISDTITNKGTITQNSTGSYTDLFINGNVTLNGGGTLILSQADRIRAANSGAMLTNVDNTIEGETSNSGTFGNNDTAIINSGVINANVNGAALVIDPVAGSGTFNNQSGGTVEASNGGILSLSGNGGGDFLNAGTIQQVSGGSIQLTGILTSSGVIDLGVNAMNINGGTLTLLSSSKLSLQIGSLTAYGQITGNGTIALNGQLILSLVNGYQPGSGNTFTIITGSNVSGSFTNLNSGRVAVTGGGSFLVTETGTTVTLSNYSATMAAAIHKAFTANVPASSSVTTKSTAATEPQANSDKVVVSKVAARSTSTGTGALVSSKQASRSGAVKIIHVSDSSQLQTLMDKAHPSGGRMIVQPNAANTKSSPEGKLGRNAVWRETLEARDKRPDQMPRNMQARLPQ